MAAGLAPIVEEKQAEFSMVSPLGNVTCAVWIRSYVTV